MESLSNKKELPTPLHSSTASPDRPAEDFVIINDILFHVIGRVLALSTTKIENAQTKYSRALAKSNGCMYTIVVSHVKMLHSHIASISIYNDIQFHMKIANERAARVMLGNSLIFDQFSICSTEFM